MANTLRDMVSPASDFPVLFQGRNVLQGQHAEAIPYYQRAISANPDFADAYCGLCQATNAVCYWNGRGKSNYVYQTKE
jgi:hypothetical protein